MESTKDNFLSWIEISEMVDNGEKLNPIDQFIYDNSPAGDEEAKFREQLYEAVCYENEETKIELLKESNEIIRSFYAVINRKGEQTNWSALKDNVTRILAEQHQYFSDNDIPFTRKKID